jgi:hypothetical protein
VDRWQESTWETEYSGEDRWRVLVQVESILVDYFRVLKVGESRDLYPDSRNREVQNSESMKSFIGEPAFVERIGVRHFGSFEDKRSGFFAPEFPKSRNATQLWRRTRPKISAIHISGFGG